MGKIKDYSNQVPVLTGDKVIGSAGLNGETKNFTVDALSTFIQDNFPAYVSKITAGTNITISPIGGTGDVTINATSSVYTLPTASGSTLGGIKIGTGLSINGSGIVSVSSDASNYQKTITYPADFTGTNYTLTNADNGYSIIVANGATAVTITVPTGLTSKMQVGFIQDGTADITFTPSSTTLNNAISGYKIKGQYYQAFLEQGATSSIYYLLGNTKV